MRFRFAVIALSASIVAVIPSVAAAQDAIAALQQQSTAMYTKYIGTLVVLIESAGTLDSARGIKDDAAARMKLVQDLKAAATKIDLKLLESGSKRASADAEGYTSVQADTSSKLSGQAGKLFLSGLTQYMVGVRETAGLAAEAPSLLTAVTAASAGNKLKLLKVKDEMNAAKEMGKGIPELAKSHGAAIGGIKNYVAKQGLKIDQSTFTIGK